MLRRDKNLLESLTNKYSKREILKVLNEDMSMQHQPTISRLERKYNGLVDAVAKKLIDDGYANLDYLRNAVDGLESDATGIFLIMDVYLNEDFDDLYIFEDLYSIDEITHNKDIMRYADGYVGQLIRETLWDILDSEDVYREAYEDLYDLNCALYKKDYGGGGWEFEQDLANDILKRVMWIAKNGQGLYTLTFFNNKMNREVIYNIQSIR